MSSYYTFCKKNMIDMIISIKKKNKLEREKEKKTQNKNKRKPQSRLLYF